MAIAAGAHAGDPLPITEATLSIMRTTLTLDDDVAAALGQRHAERGTGLRREVNELLHPALVALRV